MTSRYLSGAATRTRQDMREFGPWKLIVAIMRLRIGEWCYGMSCLRNFFFPFLRFDTVSRKYINRRHENINVFHEILFNISVMKDYFNALSVP